MVHEIACEDCPMIRFENLSKSFTDGGKRTPIIENVSFTFPQGQSLALMGPNGAGKSTLLRLMVGTLRPDQGSVRRAGKISWPIGFAGAFHGDLTGAQNVRFIARIYGVDTAELCDFVADFTDLGGSFHKPVRTYSAGMRARLTLGAAMGIRFDTYLIDEVTAVGDAAFRRKSQAVLATRLKTASAIIVNHNLNEVQALCDAGLILHQGTLAYFPNLKTAIARYKTLMQVA